MAASKQYTTLTTAEVNSSLDSQDRPKSYIRPWTWEIVGAIFSILCIVATAVLLASINNAPYRPWTWSGTDITPNTVISIFAALSKAALLPAVAAGLGQLKWLHFREPRRLIDLQHFDDASRGPAGAIVLLWSTRLSNFLAAFGAILVVLSIATEPFVQQILTYPNEAISKSNSTVTVDTGRVLQLPGTSSGMNATEATIISTQMSAAIAQGVSGASAGVQYTCPSGTCHWDTLMTLGMCNQCDDISHLTAVSCHNVTSDCTAQIGSQPVTCLNAECTYTMPNGASLPIHWSLDAFEGFTTNATYLSVKLSASKIMGDVQVVILGDNSTTSQTSSNTSNGIFANLTTFMFDTSYSIPAQFLKDVVGDNNVTAPMTAALMNGNIMPNVSLCTMRLCRQEVDLSIVDGLYHATIVDESPVVIGCDLSTVTTNNDYATNHCPVYSPHDVPAVMPNPDDIKWPPLANDTSLWVDKFYMFAVQQAVLDGFDTDSRTYLTNLLYNQNGGNVSKTYDMVAQSLSNQMQNGVNATQVTGYLSQPVPFVQVRWGWLSYPIVLAIAGVAFLTSAIVASARHPSPIWKTSSLPLLFHGLDVSTETIDDQCRKDMAKSAAGMRRKLGRTNTGALALVSAHDNDDVEMAERDP